MRYVLTVYALSMWPTNKKYCATLYGTEVKEYALRSFDVKQQDLVYQVFYERKKLKEIAEKEKVSLQLILGRLQTILEHLRIKR